MFEGLRTVIPLSNNLTLLLRLTSSSPGSDLQKSSWEHFFQSLVNAKITLIPTVILTGPQRFLCQKGKFHIKTKKLNECTLKSPDKTGSDIIRQTPRHKKQTYTFDSPRGQHLVPAPIHPDRNDQLQEIGGKARMWQSITDKCFLRGRVPSDVTFHNIFKGHSIQWWWWWYEYK